MDGGVAGLAMAWVPICPTAVRYRPPSGPKSDVGMVGAWSLAVVRSAVRVGDRAGSALPLFPEADMPVRSHGMLLAGVSGRSEGTFKGEREKKENTYYLCCIDYRGRWRVLHFLIGNTRKSLF